MPNDNRAKSTRSPACPICGKPTVTAWRPFCSKRCADVDLGRWLHGSYAFPGEPADSPPPDMADETED